MQEYPQAAEKDPYASLRLIDFASTYKEYASAHRSSRALPLDLFEQPAKNFPTEFAPSKQFNFLVHSSKKPNPCWLFNKNLDAASPGTT
jgi:hypothetical protein